MKFITTLIASAAAFAAVTAPAVAQAETTAPAANQTSASASVDLTLGYTNIAAPQGAILVALFDSQAAYDGGAPVRSVMIPASGTSAETVIAGLPAGRYAIKSFHDIDGDGKMATNPFGMPTEPFAFSNSARGNMGPAGWDAASFEVSAAAPAHTISFR